MIIVLNLASIRDLESIYLLLLSNQSQDIRLQLVQFDTHGTASTVYLNLEDRQKILPAGLSRNVVLPARARAGTYADSPFIIHNPVALGV